MTYSLSESPLRADLVFELGLLAATPMFWQVPTLHPVFLEVGPHGLTSFTSKGSKLTPSSSDGFPKAKGYAPHQRHRQGLTVHVLRKNTF